MARMSSSHRRLESKLTNDLVHLARSLQLDELETAWSQAVASPEPERAPQYAEAIEFLQSRFDRYAVRSGVPARHLGVYGRRDDAYVGDRALYCSVLWLR